MVIGIDCPKDFYKPGLPDTVDGRAVQGITRGMLTNLWRKTTSDDSESFIVRVMMPDYEHEHRGAPEFVLSRFDFTTSRIDITVQIHNKTRTHIPETAWVGFKAASANSLALDKMGSWLDAEDVLFSYDFWAPHMHAVQSGFRYTAGAHSLTVESLDAALVSVGTMSPIPYWHKVPVASDGALVSLVNNIWNTNYP